MLWADFCKFQMTDSLIDARQQFTISVNRTWLNAGTLFQGDYILSILRKSLPVIRLETLLNLALKDSISTVRSVKR